MTLLRNFLLTCSFFFFFSFTFLLHSQERVSITSREILIKVDNNLYIQNAVAIGRLMIISPAGNISEYSFKIYIKGKDRLYLFKTPFRGVVLKLLYRNFGEEIWTYFPNSKKLFLREDVSKYEPILGSDITYFDIGALEYKSNYTSKLLGKDKIEGRDLYKVELTPLEKSIFGKLLLWVDSDKFLPVRVDFFDKKGQILKTKTINDYFLIGNKYYPKEIEIVSLTKGTTTLMQYTKYDLHTKVSSIIFDKDKLGR